MKFLQSTFLTLALLLSLSASSIAAERGFMRPAVLNIPINSNLIVKFQESDNGDSEWCEESCDCGDFTYECDRGFSCDDVCIDDEKQPETSTGK